MVKTNMQITATFQNPKELQKENSSTSSEEQEIIRSIVLLQMRTTKGKSIPMETPSEPTIQEPSSMELALPAWLEVPRRKRKVIRKDDEPEDATGEGTDLEGTQADVDASTTTTSSSDNKRYILGFSIDLEWCKSQNYTELLEVLEFQEWIYLFSESYRNPLYPDAMNDFCENWNLANGTCSSTVNGVPLSFDANFLSQLFLVPNAGYDTYFKGRFELKIGNATKDDILEFLGGTKGKNKIDHKALSPFHRLLLNFVWRAIIPRTQKRNEANFLDCTLIFCLANKIQINFPSLMLQHLEHTVPSGFQVGYGALFTSLFLNSRVPLSKYGFYPQKDAQILKESTMKNLSLRVEGGKTVNLKGGHFRVSSSRKSVKESSRRKAPAVKIEEFEQPSSQKDTVAGKRKKVEGKTTEEVPVPRSRKSLRLAFKEHRPTKSPETIILDDDEILNDFADEGIHENVGMELGNQEQIGEALVSEGPEPVDEVMTGGTSEPTNEDLVGAPETTGETQEANEHESSTVVSASETHDNVNVKLEQLDQEPVGLEVTGATQEHSSIPAPVTKYQVVQVPDHVEILRTGSHEAAISQGIHDTSESVPAQLAKGTLEASQPGLGITSVQSFAVPTEPITEPSPLISPAPPIPKPTLDVGVPSSFSTSSDFSTFSHASLEQLLKPFHEKMDKIITTQEKQQQQLDELQKEFGSLKTKVTAAHEELTQKMDEMAFEPLPVVYPNNCFP